MANANEIIKQALTPLDLYNEQAERIRKACIEKGKHTNQLYEQYLFTQFVIGAISGAVTMANETQHSVSISSLAEVMKKGADNIIENI